MMTTTQHTHCPTKRAVLAYMATRNYRRIANGVREMTFEKRDTSYRISEWRWSTAMKRWERLY